MTPVFDSCKGQQGYYFEIVNFFEQKVGKKRFVTF